MVNLREEDFSSTRFKSYPCLEYLMAIFAYNPKRVSTRAEHYCLCLEVREGISSKPVLVRAGIQETVSQIVHFPEANLMAADKNSCSESLISPIRFEVLDLFHWLSAGMTSFARGLNDAPKIVALALGASALGTQISSITSFLLVALAMGLGSVLSGLKVTETLIPKRVFRQTLPLRYWSGLRQDSGCRSLQPTSPAVQ